VSFGPATPAGNRRVAGSSDSLALRAAANGARYILATGRPLHVPIVLSAPFAMSTRDEIAQALGGYRGGRLAVKKALFTR